MCIQQPQDSSQRSAVIAHYNQSSWAHLGSPFGILHWEKHKTKPQIPPQLCVLHKPLQQEQNERMGLCDRGFPQRMARTGQGAGEGTACSCGSIRAAQGHSLSRGSTQELVWAAGWAPSPPRWAPSNHRGSPATDLQGKSRARARRSNQQRRKWECWEGG